MAVVMIQGTASHVGKSLLAAAVCRLFARRGWRVAPFKAQNMSNNAAVCADGSEIGRAQALQALAAGVDPTPEMNPILLKPEADTRCQVIVRGRPEARLSALSYEIRKRHLWGVVTDSLDRLRQVYDLIVIEGAGSPVELNLKSGDIVNMAVARYSRAPVLLVGNIDVGGIFAQLLGTLDLLEQDERRLIRGLIVNQFRGDRRLFDRGVEILEQRGGVPVLGVIPFLKDLGLPEEDAVGAQNPSAGLPTPTIEIVVPRLPHLANFDDLDPLRGETGVHVRYVTSVEELGRPNAIALLGTKSTVADLEWLRERGLADAINALCRQGCAVVGLCGGFQMLGDSLQDPEHIESENDWVAGLGLLPVETTFAATKATYQVRATIQANAGWLAELIGYEVEGYEIHHGRSMSSTASWLTITQRGGFDCNEPDGAMVHQGRVWGCYLHGVFANDRFRWAWLRSLNPSFQPGNISAAERLQAGLDRLADAVESALSFSTIEDMVREGIAG